MKTPFVNVLVLGLPAEEMLFKPLPLGIERFRTTSERAEPGTSYRGEISPPSSIVVGLDMTCTLD
jgi:hypothetical protein